MKRVLVYLQPIRTYLPCSGVGRHINSMVLELAGRSNFDITLLFSHRWLGGDGKLPVQCPLRDLPFRTYSLPERMMERSWKLCGRPNIDRLLRGMDLLYCPSDTAFPETSIPSIVTIHDVHPLDPLYPAFELKRRFFSQRRRWESWVPRAMRTASAVLTVSEFCKNRMQSLIPQVNTPIHVVGNGVDKFFFDLAKREPTGSKVFGPWPYTVVVGGLTDRKGAEPTLKVARFLESTKSDLRIVVVGRSEAKWVEASRSMKNVVHCGPICDDELGQILVSASSLLFLSQYEGFGIPIIEAMAARVPVVCSDSSSLPEVAGNAGFVLPSGSTAEIAATLIQLTDMEGPERRRRIALGSVRASMFTWASCVDRLETVFEGVG